MRYRKFLLPILTSGIAIMATLPLAAQEIDSDSSKAVLDNVTIIGHRRESKDIPGSAHVVDQEELQKFLQSDVMRVLRTVPGVYIQEEEGFGLRPNIGIRGSGLDRSARVALLEDGVLIAPAPYSASSAYYFPTQRRIHSLEILKGPAAVAVGPRTTGGAINLISTPIPSQFGGTADVRLGQHDTLDAHLNIGNRGDRFSWLIETVQAQNDGFKTIDGPVGAVPGTTGYDIEDYVVKLQFDSAATAERYQSLRFKAGYTDQISDETYVGLTEADFVLNPYRRYAASAGDQFTGEHEQLQLSYVIESDSNWRGEVTAYRNNFARDWFKTERVAGVSVSNILSDPTTFATEFAYLTGTTSPDDAVLKRHNNREYYAHGVQGAISWALEWNGADIGLKAGVRIHEDEEDRLQSEDLFRMQDLELVLTSVGAPGSQANRVSSAEALSYFVNAEIRTGNWIFTPGARFEDIEMERLDYSTTDPGRLTGPTSVRTNSVQQLIPGFGALYRIGDNWRFFGSLSKGYNPPGPGSRAREEESLNVEFGSRFAGENLNFETTWFLNDYDNLVGTVTASTGGGGLIGDQFDGGKVTVQGLEMAADYTWTGLFGRDISIPVSLQYTWTADADFGTAFDSGFGPWGNVQAGDELPYIPEQQLRAAVAVQSQRIGVNVAASYVGRMRTLAGQGAYIPAETIASHLVWDFLASWQWTESLSTYIKVDNLFDEIYVAARRPAGVRPGLGRTAYVGLIFTL